MYTPISNIYNSLFAYRLGKEMSGTPKENPNSYWDINGDKKGGNISKNGVLLGGISLLGSLANWNENNQRQNIVNQNRAYTNANNYINVPFDNRYGSYNQDMFNNSSFQDGGLVSQLGYRKDSPYKNEPYLDINSSNISMSNVDQPLLAISNLGERRIMFPKKNYQFQGDVVREIPIQNYLKKRFQDGGEQSTEPQYESWQQGYEAKIEDNPTKANSVEDYIKDNPFDYDMIEQFGQLFSEKSEVIVDPQVEEWNIWNNYEDSSVSQNNYFNQPQEESVNNIIPIVNQLQSMGLKPSSVNTGEHNENSLHYQNRAVDLGLNTTFGGNENKMQEFINKQLPLLKQQYPNLKLRDERTKPNGQKVWSGSHLHLELPKYESGGIVGDNSNSEFPNLLKEVEVKPNIQTVKNGLLSSINFDSDQAINKENYLVVKDINTKKDYAVKRKENGSYDFVNPYLSKNPKIQNLAPYQNFDSNLAEPKQGYIKANDINSGQEYKLERTPSGEYKDLGDKLNLQTVKSNKGDYQIDNKFSQPITPKLVYVKDTQGKDKIVEWNDDGSYTDKTTLENLKLKDKKLKEQKDYFKEIAKYNDKGKLTNDTQRFNLPNVSNVIIPKSGDTAQEIFNTLSYYQENRKDKMSQDELDYRRRLLYNISAYDYDKNSINQKVKDYQENRNIRLPSVAENFNKKDDNSRQDYWGKYLGLPEYENKFKLSPYKENAVVPLEKEKESLRISSIDKYINSEPIAKGDFGITVKDIRGSKGNLGEYTISRGKDNKGEFISIYDKWDLDPIEQLVGKDRVKYVDNVLPSLNKVSAPFEIYDRVYLKDLPKLKKDAILAADKKHGIISKVVK